MKKRILPILLLLLPYLYLGAFFLIPQGSNINSHLLLMALLWILFFVVLLISSIIFIVAGVLHKQKCEFYLFWNMLVKLCYIPIYLGVFFVGTLIFMVGFIFIPFLIVFDYMLLLLTTIYGVGGIVQARREGKLSKTAAVVLGLFHFFFCTDVVCSVVAFCMAKSKKARK